AQSAERALRGELPHRDFQDLYTGGLTYLNAFAFRSFGINLSSVRLVFFLFFLAWVPAVYFVASRFTSVLGAGTVTLLAVSWSIPNYSAAMPSWYNLFFAVFGTAALLRYLQSPRQVWLLAAGLSGGLSVLAKISGVYYIAAVLLFLVFREQCLARSALGDKGRPSRVYSLFIGFALLAFTTSVGRLILKSSVPANLVYFVLPPTC